MPAAHERVARVVSWSQLAAERPELVAMPQRSVDYVPTKVLGQSGEYAVTNALRLHDALVGRIGVVFDDVIVVDDAHYVPREWRDADWLPFQATGDECRISADPVRTIDQPVMYVDALNGRRNFGHFTFDTLPYAAVQAALAADGIAAAALVPDWSFVSQRELATRLFAAQEHRELEWLHVRDLLLPPRQFEYADHHRRVPRESLQWVAAALPEIEAIRSAPPSGPPVYLWREWGYFGEASVHQFRNFANGPEVDAACEAAGFVAIDAATTPVMDVIAAVAAAPAVAGVHGAALGHFLWANRHGRLIELTGPNGSWGVFQVMAQCLDLPSTVVRATANGDHPVMNIDTLTAALHDVDRG